MLHGSNASGTTGLLCRAECVLGSALEAVLVHSSTPRLIQERNAICQVSGATPGISSNSDTLLSRSTMSVGGRSMRPPWVVCARARGCRQSPPHRFRHAGVPAGLALPKPRRTSPRRVERILQNTTETGLATSRIAWTRQRERSGISERLAQKLGICGRTRCDDRAIVRQ